jgi:hypothetical protein
MEDVGGPVFLGGVWGAVWQGLVGKSWILSPDGGSVGFGE